MTTQGQVNELLNQYRDATFDNGYYQATIEKLSHILTKEQLKEYDLLNKQAISKRQEIHEQIFNLLYPKY